MIKFSEIEKLSTKKLIIQDGKPFWEEHILSGEINFKQIDDKLIKTIKDEVLNKISGEIKDEELAYRLIPYMTDVEDDIDLERFTKMIGVKNDLLITLYEGIMDLFAELVDYSEKLQNVKLKAEKFESNFPAIDIKEIKKTELEKLYIDFAATNDSKVRDNILKRIIELKNEIGE